jgi:hypothetical protein
MQYGAVTYKPRSQAQKYAGCRYGIIFRQEQKHARILRHKQILLHITCMNIREKERLEGKKNRMGKEKKGNKEY